MILSYKIAFIGRWIREGGVFKIYPNRLKFIPLWRLELTIVWLFSAVDMLISKPALRNFLTLSRSCLHLYLSKRPFTSELVIRKDRKWHQLLFCKGASLLSAVIPRWHDRCFSSDNLNIPAFIYIYTIYRNKLLATRIYLLNLSIIDTV